MPDTIQTLDRHGIGGNSGVAPLAEVLADETATLRSRAEDLVAAAGRATVTDEDTSGRATALAATLADHAKTIEAEREARKKPHLEAGRIIDGHFAALKQPLEAARKTVLGMIDAYRRQREAEAVAERRRLEEEARKQRATAEAAERARREAEAAAARAETKAAQEAAERQRLEAEIAERQAADRAAVLQQQAETTVAKPIESELGVKAHARVVWKHVVDDRAAALKHAVKVDPDTVFAAVEQVIGRQVRAGVRTFPGARIYSETQTVVR